MDFPHNPETGTNGDSSPLFMKLKDKDTIKGVFRGEPFVFYSKWENGKSIISKEGEPKARFRFRINFVYKENGILVSKIWEQGGVVYNQLKDLNGEYELSKTLVSIKRNGSDMSTTYSILPSKNGTITETEEKALINVKLHELKPKEKPVIDEDPMDNIPF